MTSEISAMLDELMGKNRNNAPDSKQVEGHWSDTEVCKYFLCGFCPAELFVNTRSDLGPCEKMHDEAYRTMYIKSEKYMKMNYETDFLRYLQQCMTDVERRIRRNHQRLQLSEEKNAQKMQQAQPNNKDTEDQITLLTNKIDGMLEQIEQLGSEGNVEEAQGVMKLVDQLKEDREQLRLQKGNSLQILEGFSVQEKQMEVCEVCGAFLIVGDAQSRVDDHLMGKQHMGYAKIKAMIEELKERINKFELQEKERRLKSEKKRREERQPSKKDHRDRDKDRDRHRERHHRRSSRDRDRDRRRSRSRDRDRRRSHRSRSRDRGSHKHSRPRSRSQDRDRDRRRSKRSRSRDRDRKRSRSRDRGKKRSYSKDERDRDSIGKKARSKSKDDKREEENKREEKTVQDKKPHDDKSNEDKNKEHTEEQENEKGTNQESNVTANGDSEPPAVQDNETKNVETADVAENSKIPKETTQDPINNNSTENISQEKQKCNEGDP